MLKLFPDGYDPQGRGVAESGCGKLAVLSEMLCQLFGGSSGSSREKVVIVSNSTQVSPAQQASYTYIGEGLPALLQAC